MLTYRGTAMPETALAFFEPGTKYRTNMFLATSFKSVVAKHFMRLRSCSPALFTDSGVFSSGIPSDIPSDIPCHPGGHAIPSDLYFNHTIPSRPVPPHLSPLHPAPPCHSLDANNGLDTSDQSYRVATIIMIKFQDNYDVPCICVRTTSAPHPHRIPCQRTSAPATSYSSHPAHTRPHLIPTIPPPYPTPQVPCNHVNYIRPQDSAASGEYELLFSAYSAFYVEQIDIHANATVNNPNRQRAPLTPPTTNYNPVCPQYNPSRTPV